MALEDKYLARFDDESQKQKTSKETLFFMETTGKLTTYVNRLVEVETSKLKREIQHLKEDAAKNIPTKRQVDKLSDMVPRFNTLQRKFEGLNEKLSDYVELKRKVVLLDEKLSDYNKLKMKANDLEQKLSDYNELKIEFNTQKEKLSEANELLKTVNIRSGNSAELGRELNSSVTVISNNLADTQDAVVEASKKMDEDKTNVGGTKDYKDDAVDKIKRDLLV